MRPSIVPLFVLLLVAPALLLPVHAVPDPTTIVRETACGLDVAPPSLCPAARVDWWSDTPGVGWGEIPARSLLDNENGTLYTAATVHGTNDGGSGCAVYAVDTTSGLKRWTTVIAETSGCGLVLDLEQDPRSGDLLIAGYDWGGTHRGGVHRVDDQTGVLVWQRTFTELVVSTFAVDTAARALHALAWDRTHEDGTDVFLTVDLATGTPRTPVPVTTPDHESFQSLDVTYHPERGRLIVAGGLITSDPNDPWDRHWTAGLVALDTAGSLLWVAADPTPRESFGAAVAASASADRAFLAGTNGILTVNATTGAVLGLAPLERGTTWDDIVLFYRIAYDDAHDTAVMIGSRSSLAAGQGAALAAVAARGSDGAALWDTDLHATHGYAVAGPPVFAGGSVWFTGTVLTNPQTGGFNAVVGAIAPTTGDAGPVMALERAPGDRTATHYLGATDARSFVVAGMAGNSAQAGAFEAHLTFD